MATMNPTQPPGEPKPGAGGATLDTLSARYLQHLESLNYSPETLCSKEAYFHRFGEFLAEAKITDLSIRHGGDAGRLSTLDFLPADRQRHGARRQLAKPRL